jgi:hypothetical protein
MRNSLALPRAYIDSQNGRASGPYYAYFWRDGKQIKRKPKAAIKIRLDANYLTCDTLPIDWIPHCER